MALSSEGKYLVVNADDFGRSHGVNTAVLDAFKDGILNSASLMAAGKAFDEAVHIARSNPGLSVGVHLTLCDGKSVLPHSRIPGLVDQDGEFQKGPALAGLLYWFKRRSLSGQIEAEIKAQVQRILDAGIPPSHIDSHHHLHIHPLIFPMAAKAAAEKGIRWIRVPREPFSASVQDFYKLSEWGVFKALGGRNERRARALGLDFPASTFCLSRRGRPDEKKALRLFSHMGARVCELYAHPDAETAAGAGELGLLKAPSIRKYFGSKKYILCGYREIPEGSGRVSY